jgi:hypothetical protein
LLSYHWDYQSAMNAINPKIETVINKSEEKIVETVVKSEKFSKLENQERKKNVITNKNTKLVDSQFSKKCEGGLFSKGYKKGTVEFDDCVKKEEKLAALDMQKKQELDQAKIQEEQLKISKMKPDDRRTYTCNEKFGFRKGSDKFKDCIFELYKAETELEKLELQKQVAKANADAARANAEAARAGAERQERLALAQTEAAKMQALAARQQAIAANTADSLALIESGLRMMSPQPAPRMRTTCTYTGGFMNCF